MADPDRPSVLRQLHEYFIGLTALGRIVVIVTIVGGVGLIGFSAVQCQTRMAYDDCVSSRKAQYGVQSEGVISGLIAEDCKKITS